MIAEDNKYGWGHKGLRIRYRLKTPICRGLISAAPWVDLTLVILFFFLAGSRLVLYPGAVLKLPKNAQTPELRRGVTVVVLSHETSDGARREVIFFDDELFVVESMDGLMGLVGRFAVTASNHTDAPLLIQADVNVRHGTISTLCNVARAAGFKEVGFVMRPPEEESSE